MRPNDFILQATSLQNTLQFLQWVRQDDVRELYKEISRDFFFIDFETITKEEAQAWILLFNISEYITSAIENGQLSPGILPEEILAGYRNAACRLSPNVKLFNKVIQDELTEDDIENARLRQGGLLHDHRMKIKFAKQLL